jgi:hypothetical protein
MYDAELNIWIKHGGDNELSKLLTPAVPYELFLRLCQEVGAHPWFVQPYLSAAPHSNLMTSLAAYVDAYIQNPANDAAWMIPYYELVCNEDWNSAGAFYGTRYGWNKGQIYWPPGDFQTHDYHGRVFSKNAQAIWDTLGVTQRTPNRFKLVCAVQTYGSAAANESGRRLDSTKYVAENPGVNRPAKDYCDAVACANYFGIGGSNPEALYTQEIILAMQYQAAANNSVRLAILDQYIALFEGGVSQLLSAFQTWRTFATNYGVPELICYEGGYSMDYTQNDLTGTVVGVNRGNTTTIITTSRLPYPGMNVFFIDIGGTTGLNGNTTTNHFTVLSTVNATAYIVSANSSAMGAFSSNGTAIYVGTRDPVNIIRAQGRTANSLVPIARRHYENFFKVGGVYPSKFMFSGDGHSNTATYGQVWAGFFPTLYGPADGTQNKEMLLLQQMTDEINILNFTIRV